MLPSGCKFQHFNQHNALCFLAVELLQASHTKKNEVVGHGDDSLRRHSFIQKVNVSIGPVVKLGFDLKLLQAVVK